MLKFDFMGYNYPHISGDVSLKAQDIIKEKAYKQGTLRIKSSNVKDIYFIGYTQEVDTWEKKAGYTWSSRTSVVNREFNTTLTEVCYKTAKDISYQVAVIDINLLQSILPADYYIKKDIDERGEVQYTVRECEK